MMCNSLNYWLSHFLANDFKARQSILFFPGTTRYLSESLVPVKSIPTYNYFVWK